jgi:hypothetical protein
MMRRKDRYKRAIRGWDWARLGAKALAAADDDPSGEGYVFLGTVFGIMPSGKYYMPWACGNVAGCRQCGGTGDVKNGKADPGAWARLKLLAYEKRMGVMDEYGPYSDGEWPAETRDWLRSAEDLIRSLAPTLTCSWCAGLGSHEAAQDEDFREALEEVADHHGLWLTSGEGDPCDLLVGISIDVEDPAPLETI